MFQKHSILASLSSLACTGTLLLPQTLSVMPSVELIVLLSRKLYVLYSERRKVTVFCITIVTSHFNWVIIVPGEIWIIRANTVIQ